MGTTDDRVQALVTTLAHARTYTDKQNALRDVDACFRELDARVWVAPCANIGLDPPGFEPCLIMSPDLVDGGAEWRVEGRQPLAEHYRAWLAQHAKTVHGATYGPTGQVPIDVRSRHREIGGSMALAEDPLIVKDRTFVPFSLVCGECFLNEHVTLAPDYTSDRFVYELP